MTRFEKDLEHALTGDEISVLKARKAEIEKLEHEGRWCKNKFRQQCIAQELARLKTEYDKIESYFN